MLPKWMPNLKHFIKCDELMAILSHGPNTFVPASLYVTDAYMLAFIKLRQLL
jgi:hypothetical protein